MSILSYSMWITYYSINVYACLIIWGDFKLLLKLVQLNKKMNINKPYMNYHFSVHNPRSKKNSICRVWTKVVNKTSQLKTTLFKLIHLFSQQIQANLFFLSSSSYNQVILIMCLMLRI